MGTENNDRAKGVAVDSADNVYITGSTEGSLGGINPAGDDVESDDAWLAKYDSNGDQLWLQQLGIKDDDEANGVAVDSAGNIYITGYTDGFPDESDRRMASAVLAQYNSDGKLIQIALKDNLGDGDYVESSGIAVDRAGNVYTTVDTYNFDFMTDVSNSDSLLRIYSYS
ncbi:MAG TPA: SBBP repeat-containing protein [Leptolyngbyaceae cyanobacterium]